MYFIAIRRELSQIFYIDPTLDFLWNLETNVKINNKTLPIFYHEIQTRAWVKETETQFPPDECYQATFEILSLHHHKYARNPCSKSKSEKIGFKIHISSI